MSVCVCVCVQVCLEGGISRSSVMSGLSRGKRASGDLIPWTIAQQVSGHCLLACVIIAVVTFSMTLTVHMQFTDEEFASLSGARVVRIATHPDFQGMGYGSRALQLLSEYFQGRLTPLDEGAAPKNKDIEVESVVVATDSGKGLLKETISPRSHLPPLLTKLSDRPPEPLDYIGVSYGLTALLYK